MASKGWWLEDCRKLDPTQRKALADRNKSAIGVLKGLGVRTSEPIETVTELSPARARTLETKGSIPPYRSPEPPKITKREALPDFSSAVAGLLLRECESMAEAEHRTPREILFEEWRRFTLVARVLAFLLLVYYLVTRR
jgi:hypothetical protein